MFLFSLFNYYKITMDMKEAKKIKNTVGDDFFFNRLNLINEQFPKKCKELLESYNERQSD
jgi:hypothetical protein